MNPIYFLPKGRAAVVLDATITDGKNHVIVVKAAGDVNVEYEDGSSEVWTVTTAPGKIYGRIAKVLSTSTTVSAANLSRFSVGV
jgi:hypothetical protein